MQGLTSAGVLENRKKYGENRLTPPSVTPWYIKFLMQFANFFALLLLAGGTLCFIGYGIDTEKDATNLYLGIVLYAVVLITATFSYLQEAKSEKIMEGELKKMRALCLCFSGVNTQQHSFHPR